MSGAALHINRYAPAWDHFWLFRPLGAFIHTHLDYKKLGSNLSNINWMEVEIKSNLTHQYHT
jgi:hypothetical protein